jgi:hypothetical protein
MKRLLTRLNARRRLSHALTHTHSLSLSLTHTHTRTISLSLSLTHILAHTYTLFLSTQQTESHSHPHKISFSFVHTTHKIPFLPKTHTHTHTLTHANSLSLSLTQNRQRGCGCELCVCCGYLIQIAIDADCRIVRLTAEVLQLWGKAIAYHKLGRMFHSKVRIWTNRIRVVGLSLPRYSFTIDFVIKFLLLTDPSFNRTLKL